MMVETATDNPTRTVGNVRRIFKDHGGNMGNTGSVNFMFKQMGVFRLAPEGLNLDDLELELIDHGLEEMGESTGEKGEKLIVARCLFKDFGQLQSAIEARKITPLSSGSEWIAENLTELPNEKAEEVLKLVDALEQDDDVQHVFHALR
jgi:transcriptional/translational regulatory protein YebC/TACO1